MERNRSFDGFCLIIGLGGVTCGGKSTIAHKIASHLRSYCPDNLEILILNQDDFYLPEEKCVRLFELNTWNFDDKSAIDFEKMRQLMLEKIREFEKRSNDKKLLIIVEGNMIFEDEKLLNLLRHVYFFKGEYEHVKSIRDRRSYIPPDVPGYFDTVAWPAYVEHEKLFLNSQNLRRLDENFRVFKILDSKLSARQNFEEISRDIKTEFLRPVDFFKICNDDSQMNNDEALNLVTDEKYGAAVNFVGTTRSTFQGKLVSHLQYECYEPMAYKMLAKICKLARQKWLNIGKIAIFHRNGDVPTSKISIIVAVAGKHRKEAFACCDFLVDEVKSKVPIWKKVSSVRQGVRENINFLNKRTF
uniref:Molybdopterin synthase catalytic subunit n=1 Tax=Romanomermis culicivorax TaxID=13658 RepID=A0A915JLY2_ROMCU